MEATAVKVEHEWVEGDPPAPDVPLRDLTPEEFADLKDAILKAGRVIVDVHINVNVAGVQDEEEVDGRARVRAWTALRAEGHDIPPYPVVVHVGLSPEEKAALRLALNLCRRHLDRERRSQLIEQLRERGWSLRRIAEATQVSPATVWRWGTGVSRGTPRRVTGLDGKTYAAQKPKRQAVLTTTAVIVTARRLATRLAGVQKRIGVLDDLLSGLAQLDPSALRGQLRDEAGVFAETFEALGDLMATLRGLGVPVPNAGQ